MKFLNTILITSCLLSLLQAKSISGDGSADNEVTAKKEALSDLGSKIKVEVKSEFVQKQSDVGDNFKESFFNNINTSSDLPLLGVKYSILNSSDKVRSVATISSFNAVKLYMVELNRLAKDINSASKKNLSKMTQSKRVEFYTYILSLINDFNKYQTVAVFLGEKNIPTLNFTQVDIKQKLLESTSKIESLEYAVKKIVKDLDLEDKRLSFAYPKYKLSNEATQFSKVFKQYIQGYIDVDYKANTKLECSYDILKNKDLTLSCYLSQNAKTIGSKVINLPYKVIKKYKAIPNMMSYDMQLQLGMVKSKGFRVDLSTDKGTKDLLLSSKDSIKLLTKLSDAGCYYIVGTVLKDKEKFSYLLELADSDTSYRHIACQDEQTAGIVYDTIGEFDIEAPFGIETIQIFAFNTKNKALLIDKLPATKLENGYYKIVDKHHKVATPKEAMVHTRGLVPSWKKAKKKPKVVGAESFLMINTMR